MSLQPTRTRRVSMAAGLIGVGACAATVSLAALPSSAIPTSTVAFTMAPIAALDGQECRASTFTDADIIAGTCRGVPYVLKGGQAHELRLSAPGVRIIAHAVGAGNASGHLASAGICSKEGTGTRVGEPEPCVIRWNAEGTPTVLFARDHGGQNVRGTTVTAMNSAGDIAYVAQTPDAIFGYLVAHVWSAHGQVHTITPSFKGAGVMINALTDTGTALGVQLETRLGQSASTGLASPQPVAKPLSFGDAGDAMNRLDAVGDKRAIWWHPGLSVTQTLAGIEADGTKNTLVAASRNGLHMVGMSENAGTLVPTQYRLGGIGRALPKASDDLLWRPKSVNNAGTILGYRQGSAPDYLNTYELFRPGQTPLRLGPATVDGLSEKATIDISHMDQRGRLLGVIYDGTASRMVILTPTEHN